MASAPYGGGIVSHTYDTTIQYSSRTVQYYKEVDGGLTTYSTPPQPPKKAWTESVLMYGRNPQELEKVLKKIIPGKDGRIRISNTKDLPYCIHAHLTLVFSGSEYGGSGVIVGPHHVLTCGHNVYSGDSKSWATSISVYPALNGKAAPFGESSVVKAYTFADWTNKNDTNFDLALLVLNRSIGKYTGWGGVMSTHDSTLTSQRVHITGYPGDKNFDEMWTMEHIMKTLLAERFEYEIDTFGGQSGSGIWFKQFGLPIIIGIHTSGTNVINWGTRVSNQKFTEFVIHLIRETHKINKPTEKSQSSPALLPKAIPEKVDHSPPPTLSLIPQSINTTEWANPNSVQNLPPYPQSLKDFLAGNCTIWKGKKRADTHIVVPLFPQITLPNGTKVPFTLDALNTLDKAAGGKGLYVMPTKNVIEGVTLAKEFHYAVMTTAPLPATRGILDPSQIVINAGYQMPRIIEAATAILWENRRSGKRLFSDSHTFCSDFFLNYPVILANKPAIGSFTIGSFREEGMHTVIMTAPGYGSAGWRKF